MTSLLFSTDRDGTILAAFPEATIESYGERLNAPGACTFSLPNLHRPEAPSGTDLSWWETWPSTWGVMPRVERGQPIAEVLDPDQAHEVGVLRNGRVVWQGPLVTVDEGPDQIRFGAEGLLTYLRDWHVTRTLETTSYPSGDTSGPITGAAVIDRDQHLLVKALVDHGQGKAGADRRLDTTAVTASGTLRDRQYKGWELPNVYEQVQNLTDVQGGPDIHVDPASRELLLWTPRRGKRRESTIFNDRNVRAFGRRKDRNQLATQVLAVGAGEGDATVRLARTSSAGVARVGMVQKVISHKGVSNRDTLLEHADEELNERDTVPNLLSVTVATDSPALESYNVGDSVRTHHPSRYQPIDEFRRIVGRDVSPHDGEEVATLHLERLL